MEQKQKIKIVQVIADSEIGGGPRHVLGLLKHIDKEKFDVLLIAPRGWLTAEAVKIKGAGVRIVDFKNKFDVNSIVKLKKDIAEFRTSGDPFGAIIIHAHGPRAGGFCRFAIRSGEKFIYTEHIWNKEYNLKNPINSYLQVMGIRSVCKRADLIIAVSKSVKKFLIKITKLSGDKFVVIPNAIELSDSNHLEGHRKTTELVVGCIGSLVPQKGLIYLVKAFGRVTASLPKARLEIVGDGPEKEKLLLEIRKLGLESKIQLIGAQKNVRKFLSCWDLFVLPSISETFGIVILEAMEQKVPVIASAVGGIPEIIKDGKTGILVPPADSEKLAKTISWLLAEKKDRLSLSTEAYDILKKNYDWSKIIDDIENVFVGIIKA